VRTRSIVGEDAFDAGDAAGGEPGGCLCPEPGYGDGSFVAVDFGAHEAAAVVEGAVDEAAADASAGVLARVAAASDAMSSSVGDRRELPDVDVHPLPGPGPPLAHARVLATGPVSSVEAPEPLRAQIG